MVGHVLARDFVNHANLTPGKDQHFLCACNSVPRFMEAGGSVWQNMHPSKRAAQFPHANNQLMRDGNFITLHAITLQLKCD